MITRFKVEKLNGNDAWSHDFKLHKDINVFTGKNGAGKTTVLKLLWYLISGNIERVFPEITFSYALVEGDGFKLEITLETVKGEEIAKIKWNTGNGPQSMAEPLRLMSGREAFLRVDTDIAVASGSSVFFPTFRRIEGGFSISNRSRIRVRRGTLLQEGMAELSEDLSYLKHSFVSSIATHDIESLLTAHLAKTAEATNSLQGDLTKYIGEVIRGEWDQRDGTDETGGVAQANAILSGIKDKVKEIESARDALQKPVTVLTGLILEVLKHKGMRLKEVITFGEGGAAIEASHLSAGEKQMFSFLCYNAFQKGSLIFIDEPEISLHVDWQRILFPKLMEQASDNQFIIATHSPFIYSKYADKEFILDPDRGDV